MSFTDRLVERRAAPGTSVAGRRALDASHASVRGQTAKTTAHRLGDAEPAARRLCLPCLDARPFDAARRAVNPDLERHSRTIIALLALPFAALWIARRPSP